MAWNRTQDNLLLAALTPDDQRLIVPYLVTVELARGTLLVDAGQEFVQVWFPRTCAVSCMVTMADGHVADTATIGREGMIGSVLALGDRRALTRDVVQLAGRASWLGVSQFEAALARSPDLQRLCLRYVNALSAHIIQLAACATLHRADMRLCRWLLMLQDRSGADEFRVTHEFLAEMLGVRRPTVTQIAGSLQARGLIRYRQGLVQVVDRIGLEAAACECYATIRSQYGRLLPDVFTVEAAGMAAHGVQPALLARHP